jgi:signal transduction histidine kinase
LLHDGDLDDRQDLDQLEALSRTWAAAIAASAQHEGAKRLGEQLAESNRALVETQDALARRQALASLGEITAGAAHEMNNPLTVISGRSQILAAALTDMHQRRMAQQIVEQSHVLSDLITALREYSAPGAPNPAPVDLNALLATAVEEARSAHASRRRGGESGDASSPAQNRRTEQTASLPAIQVVVEPGLPLAWLDAEQMGRAIRELVRNALESESCTHVEVRAQIDPVNDRLRVQVVDDGSGLSHHALAHAFDPFFSAKPAGRQPGLGLSQARRIVEAHGGQITLENAPNGGAVAIIRLPEWRVPIAERRDAA